MPPHRRGLVWRLGAVLQATTAGATTQGGGATETHNGAGKDGAAPGRFLTHNSPPIALGPDDYADRATPVCPSPRLRLLCLIVDCSSRLGECLPAAPRPGRVDQMRNRTGRSLASRLPVAPSVEMYRPRRPSHAAGPRHAGRGHALGLSSRCRRLALAGLLAGIQLTALVVVALNGPHQPAHLPTLVAAGSERLNVDVPTSDRLKPAVRQQAVVPASPRDHPTGRTTIVALPASDLTGARMPGRRVIRYAVEVEGGLDVDARQFAALVVAILGDRRGWAAVDKVRLVGVGYGALSRGVRPQFRVTLASPALTDRLCAPLATRGAVSCWNGRRAVINLTRWREGAKTYGSSLGSYRQYVINHEVGHALGHHHEACPGTTRQAPIMLQQTIELGGCRPWPWPMP